MDKVNYVEMKHVSELAIIGLLLKPFKTWVLSTLDVGGAGDCFFRAVSHQLYGEPSYHMNSRCVGVQYMRTNPERFIESIAGDPWARYLADMSQQGTWAEALVI